MPTEESVPSLATLFVLLEQHSSWFAHFLSSMSNLG